MISAESILSIEKDALPLAAEALAASDLPELVGLLSEKDDKIRYRAFLLLQLRSRAVDDVYPFWEVFSGKLGSENSYQRSIGLMLIAENARWDTEEKAAGLLDAYTELLHDEKPITVRQCIQSLVKIAAAKPALHGKIAEALISLPLGDIRQTMRKPILLDILKALAEIRKQHHTAEIDEFFLNALSGGILDKKSKKEIQAML